MSGTLSLMERSSVVFKLCEWHMGTMKTLLSCDPTLLTCAPSSADPMHATTPHPRADLPAPRSQCLSQDPHLHESSAVPPAFLTNVDMHFLHMNVFRNDRPPGRSRSKLGIREARPPLSELQLGRLITFLPLVLRLPPSRLGRPRTASPIRSTLPA